LQVWAVFIFFNGRNGPFAAVRGDTLAEIAARLGYCNAASFTNIFRDTEGVAPREWRKRQRAGA